MARKSASKPKVQPKESHGPAVGDDAVQDPNRILKVHGRALKLNREITALAEEWASKHQCTVRMMESPFEVRAIAAKRLVQKNKLRGSVAQIAIREMFRLPNQDGTGGIEQACSSCDERVKKQSGPVVDYIRRRGLKGSGPTTRPQSGSGPSRPQRSRKLAILKSVAVKRKKRRAARQVLAPSAVEGEADYERDSPVKEEDSEEDSEEDRDLRGKRSEKRRIKVRVSELGRTARRESSFRMVLRSVEREMPLVLKENRDRPVSPEKGPLQEVDMPVVVVHPKKHPCMGFLGLRLLPSSELSRGRCLHSLWR